MTTRYSKNWRDYIKPSILSSLVCGMLICLFSYTFYGASLSEGLFETLVFWSILCVIFVSPLVLLIGFPVLMWAQRFETWIISIIFAIVGFVSSNLFLIVFILGMVKLVPDFPED